MKVLSKEEVVISGVGGHFPKCNNITSFKEGLLNNEDLLGRKWEDEIDVCNKIGVVNDVDHLDTACFGIHRQLAGYMDPMHRLTLERAFEALVDAGVNPTDVRGKRVGVFIAASVGESDNYIYDASVSGFGIVGYARVMMPNRVSYFLDVKGPSVAYDNNWSGGISVLQLARDAILEGTCDSALIGAVSLLFNHRLSWQYDQIGLLAPDGNTKAFDVNADGYARSEGVVILYLQRASEAKRCYATILNAESAFHGNESGKLLDITEPGMVRFLNNFYANCGVDPKDVDFVEAYGSAVKKYDAVEVSAFEKVFCKDRKDPLLIGSVKTNAGHAEAASFLMSIVKVLIAMETDTIPANIHVTAPNQNIPALESGKIKVVTANMKWNNRFAAINSVGLGASYGHLLLKSNSKIKTEQNVLNDNIPRLVIMSTRTEEGIQDILKDVTSYDSLDLEYVSMIQDLFIDTMPGHLFRGYAVLKSPKPEEIQQEFEHHPGNERKVWFVYSGMGSQWNGMASDLMQLPVFAAAIQKCHDMLVPKNIDLINVITSNDPKMFDNIVHSFVGIAAMQIGLTDVLHAVGIHPDGIIGHSVGELGCAYADGCITAEQMIMAAYCRGMASIEAELIPGMMAAIGMGYQKIKDQCPPTIEVACHNGPDSCTISGPTEDMEAFVKELQGKDIFAKLVNVANIAYHSRYIKPAGSLLLKYLNDVIVNPLPRSSKWVSTSIPEEEWNGALAKTSSAEYHTNNLLNSVLFDEGSKHIPKESVVIEVAPHGLLQAILKRSLHSSCTNIPLTRKDTESGLEFLLSAIGKMYLNGINLQVSSLYTAIEYPVSRGTPALSPLVHWEHSDEWRAGFVYNDLTDLLHSKIINLSINQKDFQHCIGHVLGDIKILPVTSYLEIAYKVLEKNIKQDITNVIFENLNFYKPVALPDISFIIMDFMVQSGSGEFEFSLGKEIVATGVIKFPLSTDECILEVAELDISEGIVLDASDVYREFEHRGHRYTDSYRAIKSINLFQNGSVAVAEWNMNWWMVLEAMLQQRMLKDGEYKQITTTINYIRKVNISLSAIPDTPGDITVTESYITGIISAPGIQVIGATSQPLSVEKSELMYDFIEFTSFSGKEYKNIEQGLNMCIQLVLENFEIPAVSSISIAEIESQHPRLNSVARTLLQKYNKLTCNFSTESDTKLILIPKDEPFLILNNNVINTECIKILTSSHAFMLVRLDESIVSNPQITQVATFESCGVTYSLVKKASKTLPVFVHVKTDTLTAIDVIRGSALWINELLSLVTNSTENQRIYLVSSIIPYEGIYNFVEEMRTFPRMNQLRFLFFLEKHVEESVYQNIIDLDIIVSVWQDGNVGTYLPCPIEFEPAKTEYQKLSTVIPNVNVSYIGINADDPTLTADEKFQTELGNIDYAGTDSDGNRITGLARWDRNTVRLSPDPLLQWKVPDMWSLEDAATIPNAYCIAYCALILKGRLRIGDTVLIHNAVSGVGFAAVSIALSMNCTVFATVSTTAQKQWFTKNSRCIPEKNVFSVHNTNFEPLLLLATGGNGANVILNSLPGSLFSASLRCLSMFGRLVQIGKFALEQSGTMGMYVFLKSVHVSTVFGGQILEMPLEKKEKLQKVVQDGIEEWTVRPLARTLLDHQNIEAILSTLKKPSNIGQCVIRISNSLNVNQFNNRNLNQILCDPNSSVLIYGGNAESWINLAEWLVFRGARNILVASESKPKKVTTIRRLTLMESYYKARITFTKNQANTRESARELLAEADSEELIEAVYLLPNANVVLRNIELESIHNLELALRVAAPKALLVNFLKNVTGLCQARTQSGYRVCNVQWEKQLLFDDVICSLDDVINCGFTTVSVKTSTRVDLVQETSQALYRKFTLLLPTSEELMELAKEQKINSEFVQLPAMCALNPKEIPPLFIIPGLYGDNDIKMLASQMYHPTFCAKFPLRHINITNTAKNLAKHMKEISKDGPYNLVGISWGGALAIETAKCLESSGDTVQLFLIDGAPDSIQSSLKNLGEGINYEISLLTKYLQIKNFDVVRSLGSLPDWESRLNFSIQNCEATVADREILRNALTNLKDCVLGISNYKLSEKLVQGMVKLIRPSGSHIHDFCGLLKYCKEEPVVTVDGEDHRSIVKSPSVSRFINDAVLC